jgi:nitrile hydratase accessory protein
MSFSICGRATLSAAEASPFEPFARADEAPVFDEAWHAQVLALAHTLSQAGMFTPAEWSDMLGEELREAADSGAPDDQETYYAAALRALERLVSAGGSVAPAVLSERVEVWRQAYLNTPHGHPVELAAALVQDD